MGRLIALGVVVVVAGLAAVTHAVAQSAPVITVSIAKAAGGAQGKETTVTFGEKVRVSGRISPARPGDTVTVTAESPIGTGTTPREYRVVTDSQGRFELIHRPTVGTGYSAVFLSGDYAPFGVVGARVRPKVFLRVVSVRRSSRHMTIRFTVTMAANPKGKLQAILQRQVTGTSWKQKKKIALDGLSATFTSTFPRETQRVRIVGSGFEYEKATSRVVVVRP